MKLSANMLDHLYIFSSLIFGIYSQMIIRWQVSRAGRLPETLPEKCFFVVHLLINPWVISGLVSTFLAGVTWMLAMTKFEISYAYPWMSLNLVLILLIGCFFCGESFTWQKVVGSCFICLGVCILARQ